MLAILKIWLLASWLLQWLTSLLALPVRVCDANQLYYAPLQVSLLLLNRTTGIIAHDSYCVYLSLFYLFYIEWQYYKGEKETSIFIPLDVLYR